MRKASAKGLDLPISFKDSVNVCRFIRGKEVLKAIKLLDEVIEKRRAIPFFRYKRDMPHRRGKLGPGRFPVKECKYIKKVIENAVANAKAKGLDVQKLYISKIEANRAVSKEKVKLGFKKSTHILVEVEEMMEKKTEEKAMESAEDKRGEEK
ncbi:MAG: 50S ribosomal protein L22 [Candidatus Nanoarchaeia archaeon]|nr:50S ribosomal protein L22 [Candidatus Haiyanarchaeum thermophilum]MCW1303103.1 50S ribosomal protein L22 [Candidatus Haiyanarchaeum thermophilum]MCW1303768.1 50S ribosomal protein L22 [Candidatus Haiyanarchaeum thermophilum]MCW1306617.1 50S ribosomal protein L22 [Candidatus Haiyanarchaeum thermophilum]MCW1307029.1 50S ribosomal protein L22 [Candidatus Haiyanarchaeum thermophilum]